MKTKEIINQLKLLQIRGKLKLDQIRHRGRLPSPDKRVRFGPLKDVIRHLEAKEILIQLSKQDEEQKDLIFELISILREYGKDITLIEFDNIFSNSDMRKILEKNPDTTISLRYMLDSYYSGTNVETKYGIDDYCKILEKIEYLTKVTQANFKSKDEQLMFVLTQLLEYISFDEEYKKKNEKEVKEISSLKGALFGKSTVCIGFAMAVERCLSNLGMECNIVAGNTTEDNHFIWEVNHAWNQVKIADKWYNVDLAWAKLEKSKEEAKKFLLVDDENFKGHNDTGAYPMHPCGETYQRRDELYDKMKNIKSVLTAYDSGDRGTMLQYDISNSTIGEEPEPQKEQVRDEERE